MLAVPGAPILKVPNGLEMDRLRGSKLGSKLSFGSGPPGLKNNQVAPIVSVAEEDIEVSCDLSVTFTM